MQITQWRVAAVLALVAGVGCQSDPSLTDGPTPRHAPAMFESVLTTLTQVDALPQNGDWPEDYGDANYYGPGFFLRYGEASGNVAQIEVGEHNHALNTYLISEAVEVPSMLLGSPDLIVMAAMGLIEGYRHDQEPDTRTLIKDFLDVVDVLGEPFDYYFDNFDIIYGPTTINAALALLNLEFAYAAGGPDADARAAKGIAILEIGRGIAFDEDLGYYRFEIGNDELYLYPNIMQMLAHLRVYQVTGDQLYLDRAIALHAAIQPLKLDGRYRSPYSAEIEGALTDDYTTLSSQNYTMLALSQLYATTGDEQYRQEVLDTLAFLESHLLQDGKVLHHWIDGRQAATDETYYCSGCNLQLLYIIWRLETEFPP